MLYRGMIDMNKRKYKWHDKGLFLNKLSRRMEDKYKGETNIKKAFIKDFLRYDLSKQIDDIEDGDKIENLNAKMRRWNSFKGKWENTLPNLDDMINICNALDCDMDYFLTDQDIFKNENIDATKRTGLSEKSIDNIVDMDEKSLVILNILFEEDIMSQLLDTIYDMNVQVVRDAERKNTLTDETTRSKLDEEAIKYSYANSIINATSDLYERSDRFKQFAVDSFRENHPEVINNLHTKLNDTNITKDTINSIKRLPESLDEQGEKIKNLNQIMKEKKLDNNTISYINKGIFSGKIDIDKAMKMFTP